jgi:hypothetical protein
MWMPGRFIMGGLALFLIWTLVRAWHTGWIYDGLWRFNADDYAGVRHVHVLRCDEDCGGRRI